MNSGLEFIVVVAVGTLAFVPLIAYLDYYMLRKHATCSACGHEPEKHSWLLATLLETLFLIVGLMVGYIAAT